MALARFFPTLGRRLSPKALEQRCRALEAHVAALNGDDSSSSRRGRAGGKRPQRPFDFSRLVLRRAGRKERQPQSILTDTLRRCRWRKVALRVAYLGERFHGLAAQPDIDETVEVGSGALVVVRKPAWPQRAVRVSRHT